MEINYMKEFLVLAEVGNYLEAADQLFISQSSLSRHIKAMEDELGTPLFIRARKISLSEFGKIFLPYAQKMVALQEEYQLVLHNFRRNVHDTLAVGSLPSMNQYHIIDAFVYFREQHPEYSLNLVEADTLQLLEMITEDKLELAFIRSAAASSSDQFCEISYAQDSLVAVLPADHPLASREELKLSDLSKETLVLLSSDTFMHQYCVHACKSAGFQPAIGYTCRHGNNLVAMVEKGTGIALLTKKPIESLINPKVKVIDIVPHLTTSISLIYKKGKHLSSAARQFISAMKNFDPSSFD